MASMRRALAVHGSMRLGQISDEVVEGPQTASRLNGLRT